MTLDREQELQDSILRLTSENAALKKQVVGLQRDLDHATGDIVAQVAGDVSRCRRVLEALNNKMQLVPDDEQEDHHGQPNRRARPR